MNEFIQVRYLNNVEGLVDDVTLDQLIESKRVTHFYRPSENRWIDIFVEPVQRRGETNVVGRWRRASDWEAGEGEEEKEEEREKPRGLFARLFRPGEYPAPWGEVFSPLWSLISRCLRRGSSFKRRKEHTLPKKQVSAQEWFEQGFVSLHTTDDCEGAVRAFALSIQLNPTHVRAYVSRGLAYERLGNLQQAIEDYNRAVFVNPDDAKVYYLRGLALKRLGMRNEAIADIKKAADLRYRPAYDFLKSERIS